MGLVMLVLLVLGLKMASEADWVYYLRRSSSLEWTLVGLTCWVEWSFAGGWRIQLAARTTFWVRLMDISAKVLIG